MTPQDREALSTAPRRLAPYLLVALVAVVLDQVTKAWARSALASGHTVPFVPGLLDLSLVANTGAAFSIGEGSTWVFVMLALVIVVGCTVYVGAGKGVSSALCCALGAVAGGGVGNLIDRVAAGQVTDFLATTFIDFPVFNVADVFVTCGVAIALVLVWRQDARRSDDGGEGEVRHG